MKTETKPKTVLELYEGHPERWTTGFLAKGPLGGLRSPESWWARRWCIVGAIYYVYGREGDGLEALEKVHRVIAEEYHLRLPVASWNDTYLRTFPEVLDLVRRARV